MKYTTIETPDDFAALIKLYCGVKKIKLKDIIVIVFSRDKEFKKFSKKMKTLNP